MTLNYRPEIDGLRAVAVLAVLVYHAGFSVAGTPLLTGGFIGVDIFFVISGYLICSIILRGLKDNSFSLKYFYERRARRILPALLTVMIFSVPLAWTLMLPEALTEYAGANIASLLFGSNIWFWLEDSYFAQPAALKPFLHTWSLSVEEQFYLIFPVLVMALWARVKRYILLCFILLGFLSLAVAHYVSVVASDAGFYLLPFRGWELLLGASLAQYELSTDRRQAAGILKALPLLGLVMIMGSFLLFSARTPHPSLLTALPVCGTALILWFGGRGDFISRLLSRRLLVGIGLISYSLYLWHYMLFAFARIWKGGALTNGMIVLVITASVILSIITYFLIERPARQQDILPLRRFIVLILMSLCGLFVGNYYLWHNNGLPERMGGVSSLISETKRIALRQDDKFCIDRSFEESRKFIIDQAAPTLILIGDSHADTISRLLQIEAQANRVNFVFFADGGCSLIPGSYRSDHGIDKQKKCLEKAAKVDGFIQSAPQATVMYFSFLATYLGHDGFAAMNGDVVAERPALFRMRDETSTQEAVIKTLSGWSDAGHDLVIIYPVPEAREHVPEAFQSALAGQNYVRLPDIERVDISTPLADHRKQAHRAIAALDAVSTNARPILRIDPTHIFCSDQKACRTHDEHLFYADDNHLAPYGAAKLVDAITVQLGLD